MALWENFSGFSKKYYVRTKLVLSPQYLIQLTGRGRVDCSLKGAKVVPNLSYLGENQQSKEQNEQLDFDSGDFGIVEDRFVGGL